MKAVLIVHNQSFTERVEYILDRQQLRGFTQFPSVLGRGSHSGDPRQGTHAWPEMNTATLVMVEDHQVDLLLEKVKKLDNVNEEVGIRAFVWDITQTY